nr:hypothetical protein [Nitrosomonas nitrosa]
MQYINRKFNSFLPDSGQIHNPFLPADIYTGDPVSARLRVDDTTGEFNQLPVWKISPLGVELLATQQNFCNWKPGMHVDLILTIGKQHSEFRNVTVSTVTKNHDRTLLGISWPRSKITHYPIVDQRTAKRFICGSDFFPTGIFNNSIRYKDFIYFRIQDISSTGMQLLTSLRNKLIVPGMTFESTCSFPMENQVQISIKIVNTRIVTSNGKVYLSLGVAHDARKEHVLTTIGQYLLQFGSGASLQELREAGFRVKSSSRAFNFGYAKSEEEYQQVLELRRIAYVHASKVSSDTSAKSMADEFDAKSRILIALYHSRVIGSVRLIFPQSNLATLKH